jgi:polysaccharide biosynthesis transport protein
MGQYQSKLNQEPLLEQQMADVTRGYEQSKMDYDSLLKKKNDSELATNLELQQRGEHFRILDPPNLPVKPYSPQRLKLFGLGIAAGLILAAASTALKETIDERVYSDGELRKLLPVSIIAEIPPVLTTAEQQSETRLGVLRWASAALVFTVILGAFAVTYLHG